MSNTPGNSGFGQGGTSGAPTDFSAAQQTVTNTNQQTAAETLELFAELLPLEWRGIGLPYVDFKVVLRQDLAIHKFADLDGADVEPTGRSPLEMSAKIPFLNHIGPAASETWTSGAQYPNNFRQFWAAVIDRSPDYLNHPEFGPIRCCVSHAEIDWKATTRDGVYVDVTWIETFEPNGGVSPNVSAAGQVSLAAQAGVDLDNLVPSLPASDFPMVPNFGTSFSDFARSLQGVSDQISLLEYEGAGQIAQVTAQVQAIQTSITGNQIGAQAGSQGTQTVAQYQRQQAQATASVTSWQTTDACDRYLSALANLQQNLLASGKSVGVYLPATDTSLPLLAQTIPTPISDLMNLNPGLLQDLVVPAGSQVRYYLGSVAS